MPKDNWLNRTTKKKSRRRHKNSEEAKPKPKFASPDTQKSVRARYHDEVVHHVVEASISMETLSTITAQSLQSLQSLQNFSAQMQKFSDYCTSEIDPSAIVDVTGREDDARYQYEVRLEITCQKDKLPVMLKAVRRLMNTWGSSVIEVNP